MDWKDVGAKIANAATSMGVSVAGSTGAVAGETIKKTIQGGITMKNWKTSLFGAVAGIPQLIQGILTKDYTMIMSGLSTIILGLVAKDINVTGGTVNQ